MIFNALSDSSHKFETVVCFRIFSCQSIAVFNSFTIGFHFLEKLFYFILALLKSAPYVPCILPPTPAFYTPSSCSWDYSMVEQAWYFGQFFVSLSSVSLAFIWYYSNVSQQTIAHFYPMEYCCPLCMDPLPSLMVLELWCPDCILSMLHHESFFTWCIRHGMLYYHVPKCLTTLLL